MSREKFEAWWEQWFGEPPMSGWQELRCEEGYSAEEIDHMWDAWQAATASMQAERDQLAAECAAMKSAFDKPQAYLSWHAIPPTWDDPLPCGEYLDVHDDAGHKNFDGTDCWPVYAKPDIETPATDRFLAEQRAVGVEMLAEHLSGMRISASETSVREFAAQLRNEVKV